MSRRDVDERVVSLDLENERFESKVQNTIKSLSQLTKALNLDGATDGLSELQKTANGMNFGELINGLDTINNRFNVVTYAVNALVANLTNKAVNAAERFVKSLSVDQVAAGWNKYNQQLSYVQTIMNATGKSVEDVDKIIAKLAWFSDETSFSLNEMMSALSTAAASGADLEKVIPMVEGIATATAYAGKSGNEFVHVIRNIMQSYSSGYLSLMDWKSVELMQVNSKQLEQTLIDTAVALGKLKEGQVTPAGFRDSLKDKWIDTEVMEIGFSKFSAMMEKAYKLINAGMFEQASDAIEYLSDKTQDYTEAAKKLVSSGAFTDIDSAIKYLTEDSEDYIAAATKAAQSAKTFGEMVDATADAVSTAFSNIFKEIFGDYDESVKLWTDLANFLWEVLVPPLQNVRDMLSTWKDYGGRDQIIQGFQNIYEAVVALIKPIHEVFREFIPKKSTQDLINFSKNFKKFTETLIISSEQAEKIKDTIRGIMDILSLMFRIASNVIKPLVSLISPIFNIILDISAVIGKLLSSIATGSNIVNDLNLSFEPLLNLFDKLIVVVTKIKDGFVDMFDALDADEKISTLISTIIVGIAAIAGAKIPKGLTKVFDYFTGKNTTKSIDSFIEPLKNLKGIGKNVVGMLSDVRDVLKAYQTEINARAIIKIAAAIALLGISLKVIASISADDLTNGLTALTIIIAELTAMVAILSGLSTTTLNKSGLTLGGLTSIGLGLLFIATAVAILSASVSKLGNLNPDQLAKGLFAITVVLVELSVITTMLSQEGGKMVKGSSQLILMSLAVLILSSAVAKLGSLKLFEIVKGLAAVITLVSALVAVTRLMEPYKLLSAASGMITIGVAMLIFGAAIKQIGSLPFKSIIKGVDVIIVLLFTLAASMNLMSPYKIISSAMGMVIIASAIVIFGDAVKKLGSLKLGTLIKGFDAVILLLVSLTAVINLIDPYKIIASSTGMVIMATAMIIMSSAIETIGALPFLTVIKGLNAIIIMLAALGALITLVPAPAAIGFGVGLLVISSAIAIMVAALTGISKVVSGKHGFKAMALSIFTLSLAFTSLAATAALFGLAAPLLWLGVGVMTALAINAVLLGAGMAMASVAMASMGVSLTTFAAALAGSAVLIGKSLAIILKELIKTIPELATGIMKGVIEALKTAAESLPELISTFFDIIRNVLSEIINVINETGPDIFDVVVNLILMIIEKITSRIGEIVSKIGDLLLGILNGIANWIDANGEAIYATAKHLVLALVNAIIDIVVSFYEDIFNLGKNLWTKFKEGVASKYSDIKTSVKNFISDVASAIRSRVTEFWQIGQNIVQGLKNGIKNAWNGMTGWIKNLGGDIVSGLKSVLGIHSPSKETFAIGRYVVEGLRNGISEYTHIVSPVTKKLGKSIVDGISSNVGDLSITPSVSMDLNKINDVAGVLNNDFRGSMNVEVSEISNIFNEMKSIMNTQNELLSGIKASIDAGGKMYIDGNTMVGYFDRKLGTMVRG